MVQRDEYGRFRALGQYDREPPLRGAGGRFVKRAETAPEPVPVFNDEPIVPPRRYLVPIEGQLGLLIAALLLVGLAFAMLTHP